MSKMSVSEAADAWAKEKADEPRRKAVLQAAGDVLKAHFRKTGRTDYKGLIGYSTGTLVQLDQAAVKAELGARLGKFQRRIEFERLTLLKK